MSEQRRESVFLTLSPETAKTFSATEGASSRASSFSSNGDKVAETESSLADAMKKTRSDSVSSQGSIRQRFLKLNPVRHNVDAKEADFVDVEEPIL